VRTCATASVKWEGTNSREFHSASLGFTQGGGGSVGPRVMEVKVRIAEENTCGKMMDAVRSERGGE